MIKISIGFSKQKTAIVFAISLLIIIALVFYIGPSDVLGILKGTNIYLVIFCYVIILVSYSIRTARWNYLLQPLGFEYSFSIFHLLTAGLFINTIAQFRIGELARGYWLKKSKNFALMKGFTSIIIERFVDSSALVLLVAASTMSLFSFIAEEKQVELVQAVLFSLILLLLFISFFYLIHKPWFIDFCIKILQKIFPEKKFKIDISEGISDLTDNVRLLISNRKVVSISMAVSIPIWLIETTKIYLLAMAIGYPIPIWLAFFVGGASYLLGSAIINPFGTGTMLAMIGLLLLFFPEAIAFSIAFLDVFIYMSFLLVFGGASSLYHGVKF